MINVTFQYFDNQTYSIQIPEHDLGRLVATIGKGEVYWFENKQTALWLPIACIRHIQISKA